MDQERRRQKILSYEAFLNDVLRSDLSKVVEERDKVITEIAEYTELERSIRVMKEADLASKPMSTKVDIGCNFYVQAKVPDPSKICVCVGYGFYVELTYDEALRFIDRKVPDLKTKLDRLTSDSAKVKANIKLVLEGLRELQRISAEPSPPPLDLY